MSDDPTPIDDFSEFEKQIVEQFEKRGGDPIAETPPSPGGGDGAASDESPADAAPPSPPLDFVEPVDAAAAPSAAAPASDTTTDTADTADTTATVSDTADEPAPEPEPVPSPIADIPEDQLPTLRAVYDWYSNLDAEAIQTVDAALSGQYVLVPADQVQMLAENWELLEQVRSGKLRQPGSVDTADTTDFGDDTDPEVAALRDKVAQLEYTQEQERMMERVNQTASVIDAAYDEWKQAHPYLDEQDFAVLEQAVYQSGIFPALAERYGDAQAVKLAMDQTLYSLPNLRDKALQPIIDERLQRELAAVQEQQARGTRASAIAGTSPEPPSPSSASIDPDEAMVEEIARYLRNS